MKTSSRTGLQLSKLMLGTVQLGMPYGVANRTGQPSYDDVLRIIGTAFEGGVNCFDTAAAYGASEDVVGRALRELEIIDHVTVVTKVRPLSPEALANPSLAWEAIERSIGESRRRLQIDCLPLVLFHREADAKYGDVLAELRTRGWLENYGVSCDSRPGPAADFVADKKISALQLPGNILDIRHLKSGVFEAAATQGMAVFIRSVYLQGLLLMPERDIPPELHDVIPVRRRLESLAQAAGMEFAELALRYMLSHRGVTSVITGVETVSQLKTNLEIFDRGPLPEDLLGAIAASNREVSEMVMTPNMWPNRVPS